MSHSVEDINDPYEDAPWRPVLGILADHGYEPVPADQVTEFDLKGRLWELLYALAAHRIFFFHSDHLTDREFYNWFSNTWLKQETADLPPDSDWACNVDVSEYGTGVLTGEELWLRHYASDEDRDFCENENPQLTIPRHEELIPRRDAFLPRPQRPLFADLENDDEDSDEADEEDTSLPCDDEDEEINNRTEDDPLGLSELDRELKLQSLRDQVEELGGEVMKLENLPPDVEQSFLESMLSAEISGWQRPIDEFRKVGYSPMPPAELTEETFAPVLWELIHELARRGFFMLHTDHLSDAELYSHLWKEVLHEDVILPGMNSRAAWFHDFVGSGSEEDELIWLKHYASDDSRQKWLDEQEEAELPDRQPAPYSRDWKLPKAPM